MAPTTSEVAQQGDGGIIPMQEMLRYANNHFVRTKKNLQQKSGIVVREAQRYREAASKCSFTGQGSGFAYHPSFAVGESLYQFLAIPKSRRRARRRNSTSSPPSLPNASSVTQRHQPRLKLLIPDTLVFNIEDEPQWYYTDKDGLVSCMARYEPGQAVEQFGDVRYDEDLVAVRKQSCLLPLSGLREGDDPAAVYSTGNALALVNTKDLRVITGASIGADGGKAAGAVTEGGGPFVVQKFVKSKGPHAFIVRQTVERGMPPTAWMISNRQPYGEEIEAPDSLLLAGPQLLGRFTTTPLANKRGRGGGGDAAAAATAGSCSITRLGPGACVETAQATERIKRHLEVVLDRRIELLVADFTRDDRDRLWFLQVKAFRFMGCAPRRPFRLTARAKDNARRRLQGENPGAGSAAAARGRSSSSSSTAGGRKPAKSRSMFALPVGGRGTGSSRTGGPGGDGDGGAGMETLEDRSCSGLGLGVELPGAREGGLGGLRGDWEAAEEAAVAAAACGEGRHGGGGGSGGDGRQAERKKLACGMCGAMRIPEDVSFRMTAKMVRETVFHIWSRLPPAKVPRSLRIVNGETHAGEATAAAVASIARRAAATNASNGGPAASQNVCFSPAAATPAWKSNGMASNPPKGAISRSLATANSPQVPPSASVVYENVRACEACFTLHQTEASLVRAERRLAAAVAGTRDRSRGDTCGNNRESDAHRPAKTRGRAAGEEGQHAAGWGGWDSWAGSSPQGCLQSHQGVGGGEGRRGLRGSTSAGSLGERRAGTRIGKREDNARAGDNLDQVASTGRLCLCRILVAVTEIFDVPRALLEEAAARSCPLQLQYQLLGQREEVWLENPLAQAPLETLPSGGDAAEASASQRFGDTRAEDEGAGERRGGRRNYEEGLLMPVSVNHFRVFSFLAGDTPLKGELPKGSGLDTFLTCQKEIVLTLSLGPPANNNRSRARQQQSIRGGAVAWPSPGRVGEARLGLGQFRNDHVQKVELQAPLLLSCVGQEKNRSRMLLVKAVLGLERVRSEVNISTLPRPRLHRGVYLIDDGSGSDDEGSSDGGGGGGGGGDGYHVCDPLPDAWVGIGRLSGVSFPEATHGARNGGSSRRDWVAETSPPPSPDPAERLDAVSEEKLEADPNSVWGLCLCVAGVHRPGGMAVVREGQQQRQQEQQRQQQQPQQRRPPEPEPQATITIRQRQINAINAKRNSSANTRSSSSSNNGGNSSGNSGGNSVTIAAPGPHVPPDGAASATTAAAITTATTTTATTPASAIISAPTSTDPRGWKVRCSLFGHLFSVERPMGAPPLSKLKQGNIAGTAGGGNLPLGGVEAHAYLQCGVSRLRQLLSGDLGWEGGSGGDGGAGGDGGGCVSGGATLTVQLLHDGGGGGEKGDEIDDDGRSIVRCQCEVPLESLVDSRFIEGTYPLFDSTPQDGDDEDDVGPDGEGCGSRSTSEQQPERRDLRQQQRRKRRTSSCSGGLFDPSLELGIHLYRMGPLNSYSTTTGRGSGDAGKATGSRMLRSSGNTPGGAGAGDASPAGDNTPKNKGLETRGARGDKGSDPLPAARLWKPPSLVERGKVGLDGRGSESVSLFARPPVEARRAGDVAVGGEDAGG